MPDERKPILFISHSSDDTNVARDIKAALDATFDVFLDAVALRAGGDWQQDVERALIQCDAALVLLSPAMLARPAWVLAEAYTLSLRRRQFDSSFLVIPVLLPGFAAADLSNPAIGPANLDTTQAVAINPAALDLTALVAGLEPVIRDYAARLPYDQMEDVVASLLDPVDEHALLLMADALKVPRRYVTFLHDKKRWLAREMLRADLFRLQAAHLTLAGLKPTVAPEVFRVVAPYCWIPADVAMTLRREAIGKTPKRPLAMNAAKRRTPRLYVRRASMKHPEWLTLECDGDFSTSPLLKKREQVLLDNIRAALAIFLNFTDRVPSDAELKQELLDDPRGQDPIFVLLPDDFTAMDGPLLKQVRDVFPEFTFLFCTKTPDNALAQKFDDLLLLPEFKQADEEKIYRVYGKCLGEDPTVY